MPHRRPSRRNTWSRIRWSRVLGGPSGDALRRAPRRRKVERLEERRLMAADVSSNPYFAQQWNLFANNQLVEEPNSPTYLQSRAVPGEDINVLPAWALGYTGAGVQVAVVDTGFDLTHEDLVFLTSLGFDFVGNDTDPSAVSATDSHGTAVAGIIGARNNDIGTVGIAYNSDVVPVRWLTDPTAPVNFPDDVLLRLFRYNAGILADSNGNGILDPSEVPDPSTVIDVYNHSWGPAVERPAQDVPREFLQGLFDSALYGRATWQDLNGDGLFQVDEVKALGAIHVFAAGNDGGQGYTTAFDDVGNYASSQYNPFATSRFAIAVGAVDFGGNYENPETGTTTSWAETGSNVLVVAPSGTFQIDIARNQDLNGGIRTTDQTGDDGYNSAPVFGVETDGDYFPDTNYTSTFGGTSAAAPQVSGVIALMLEANPNLSLRDVQQILLMSARQNDQFDESWITNPYNYFEEPVPPVYAYYNLDTDGMPGAEVFGAVIPNSIDQDVIRNFFLNNPDFDIDATSAIPAPSVSVDSSNVPDGVDMGQFYESPVLLFPGGANIPNTAGLDALLSPVALKEPSKLNVLPGDAIGSLSGTVNRELNFENGVGYTVSQGYGRYAEQYGYAHGVLDAELAVKLALAWDRYDLYLEPAKTITSFVLGGTANIAIQASGEVGLNDQNNPVFVVPGGISTQAINTGYYEEFLKDITTTDVQDAMGMTVGSVISDAPFYQGGGETLPNNTRGQTKIPFTIDPSTTTNFLSTEWLELTLQLQSGDIDNLRLSVISPDGTQSELTPFRNQPRAPASILQQPQTLQGAPAPGFEIIGPQGDIISGSDEKIIGPVEISPDALSPGQTWTFSTNRDWGELFSTKAQTTGGVDGQWYLVVENWGTGAASLGGQFEITISGTEATGQRIQGKIGVDDNKQDVQDQDNDQQFNFNRYLTFGEVTVEGVSHTVVLDNANDSVFMDPVYKAVDPDTGITHRYAVIDEQAYREGQTSVILTQLAAAEAFDPLVLLGDVTPSTMISIAVDSQSNPVTFRNFDYAQESFASNVVVKATQYRVDYDASGVPGSRFATGVVDYFVTGADGNYYFDVDAPPAPPDPADPQFATPAEYQAALAQWRIDYGFTLEYDITVEGDGVADRIIDKSYSGAVDPAVGATTFNGGAAGYTVQLYASPLRANGQTAVVKDVNFLLKIDPADTNVTTSGAVFVDYDADGVIDSFDSPVPGAVVYYDANGNGALDSGEASAVADSTGAYTLTLTGLAGKTDVTLRVDPATVDPSLQFLNPATGARTLSVDPGTTVSSNFTLQPIGGVAGIISGSVYLDADGNAVRGTGEAGLGGQRVYIDANGNNAYDVGETSTLTTAAGAFTLTPSAVGTYRVRVDLAGQPYRQTAPANDGAIVATLTAASTTVTGLAFGLFDRRTQDFGDLFVDATHHYPTLAADNGARHTVVPGVFLGAGLPDIEEDGNASRTATGDDTTGRDDEDGVVLVSNRILPNSTITFDITATGQGASLNAWIDFNDDGDWDDAGEQVAVNVGLVSGTTNRVTFNTPANVSSTATALAARFRWGPFGLSYTGSANAGEVEDYLLPTTPRVNVGGRVAVDANGDGQFDSGDTGLAGVVVYNDANLDGIRQASEPSAVTDANGEYLLQAPTLGAISLTVRIDNSTLGPGFSFLNPPDGIIASVANPGQTVGATFLVQSVQTVTQGVTGIVYSDASQDGVRDPGESGLAAVRVQAFDSTGTTLLVTTVTDASGVYSFDLPTGAHQIRLDLSGTLLTQTAPAGGQTVVVQAGAVADAAPFGVFDQRSTFTNDYGDLAVNSSLGLNFPTTAAQNGASHRIVPGVFLGAGVDADSGNLTSAGANADDLDGTDDEDGVRLVSSAILPSSTIELDITANGAGVLNAWIDFNGDGDWNDAGERIAIDQALVSGATTRLIVSTPSTVSTTATAIAARFRWGSAGVSYTGPAASGEVEDYLLPTRQSAAVSSLLAGDYNANGVVDQADYDVWAGSFANPSDLRADGNGDGFINAADYTIWRDNLGRSAPVVSLISAAQQGDYNRDGSIDASDYATWGGGYGSVTDLSADGNGDGVINAADFTVWRDRVTSTGGPVSLLTSSEGASIDPPGTPKLITMPIVETATPAPNPAAVLATTLVVGATVPETGAIPAEAASSGDAIDEALLLVSPAAADEDQVAIAQDLFDDEDESADSTEEESLALALAEFGA